MKLVFLMLFAALVVASVGVWLGQPNLAPAGQTPLVWATDDNPLRAGQIQLFDREHPKVDLILDSDDSDIEKVIVQSIAGVGPDLFDCRDADQLSAFVRAGIAWDVTDELKSRGIDVTEDCWKAMLPLATYEGRVYGVPTNCAVDALWFNKKVFDQEGVPYPKGPLTWEQLIPLARRMTRRGPDGRIERFGLMCEWWYWPDVLASYGGSVFSADGTRCTIDSPQAIAAFTMLHDLIYKEHVMPSPTQEAGLATQGGWGSGSMTLFAAGRCAMAIGGRWWLANLSQTPGLRLGVVESPMGTVRGSAALGRATIINKNSPRRELALKFLEYLASPEYNHLVNEQADGLAAFKRYASDPSLLSAGNPDRANNEVWLEATAYAVPSFNSAYVNGYVATDLINKQLDLIRIDAKPVADALHEAADQVNAAMQANLALDPALKRRWAAARAH